MSERGSRSACIVFSRRWAAEDGATKGPNTNAKTTTAIIVVEIGTVTSEAIILSSGLKQWAVRGSESKNCCLKNADDCFFAIPFLPLHSIPPTFKNSFCYVDLGIPTRVLY